MSGLKKSVCVCVREGGGDTPPTPMISARPVSQFDEPDLEGRYPGLHTHSTSDCPRVTI